MNRKNDAVSYFQKKWSGYTPLFKLFSTRKGKFLYDAGTNKILSCEDNLFCILKGIETKGSSSFLDELKKSQPDKRFKSDLKKIETSMRKHGILQTNPEKLKIKNANFTNYLKTADKNLGMITLEVTEQCNFRCKYCIYGGTLHNSRSHGNRKMEWRTAKNAVDILAQNSKGRKEVAVSFYGGEPLLNFPLIEKTVSYAREVFEGKELSHSVTTNGLLLNKEISEFLLRNNFGVLVSIDGPKKIHDENRLDAFNKGTFERVIVGLKTLMDVFGDASKDRVSLSIVYAPPYAKEKIDRIAGLWDDYPWLKGTRAEITYPVPGSMKEIVVQDESKGADCHLYDWLETELNKVYGSDAFDITFRNFLEKPLLKIFRRQITDRPVKHLYPNGCCVPGVRKVFVEVDGKIRLCEQINSSSPYVGDVDSGIDHESIKRIFIDDYFKKSEDQCRPCWANRLCYLCYKDVFFDRKYNGEKKSKNCLHVKANIERDLIVYSDLLEKNPRGLNYLAKIKVS